MATVTGMTAARMLGIENASVVDGNVVGNNLILVTHGGTNIDAGNVRGPIGPSGAAHIICTSTTRPSLSPAEEGKSIYETDTDLIRVWSGTRWKLQEKIICTSTTRPAGLGTADEGVKIYETDTNTEYSWTGSAWMPYSGPPIFASASDRNTKYPTPTDGSVSYLSDSPGVLWLYFGGAWHPYGQAVGTLTPSILANPPDNHCFCYGQTLVGANTLYPVLWGVVDPAWKSGSDLKIPDLRGRAPFGKDDMGGTPANRVTTPQSGINGVVMGAFGGDQRLHAHSHVATDSGHGHAINDPQHSHGTGQAVFGGGFISFAGGGEGVITGTTPAYTGISLQTSYAQIVVQSNGAGSGQNMPPSVILNWQLKLR